MSICPKNKSSKARRDKRRANWKMSAPNLVKCSKCGALMMPHRVCKACGSYNNNEVGEMDYYAYSGICSEVQCSIRLPASGALLLSLRVVWKRHIKDLTWCVVMCYNGLGEN